METAVGNRDVWLAVTDSVLMNISTATEWCCTDQRSMSIKLQSLQFAPTNTLNFSEITIIFKKKHTPAPARFGQHWPSIREHTLAVLGFTVGTVKSRTSSSDYCFHGTTRSTTYILHTEESSTVRLHAENVLYNCVLPDEGTLI